MTPGGGEEGWGYGSGPDLPGWLVDIGCHAHDVGCRGYGGGGLQPSPRFTWYHLSCPGHIFQRVRFGWENPDRSRAYGRIEIESRCNRSMDQIISEAPDGISAGTWTELSVPHRSLNVVVSHQLLYHHDRGASLGLP